MVNGIKPLHERIGIKKEGLAKELNKEANDLFVPHVIKPLGSGVFEFRKGEAKAEVGYHKDSIIKPNLKLQRWDGEVELKIEIDDEAHSIQEKNKEVKYFTNTKEYKFYQVKPQVIGEEADRWYKPYIQFREGGIEFDIILKEKPQSNKLQYKISTKNLKFYYQPFLTDYEREQQEVYGMLFRPSNVEGSYAVYHTSKKGNEYKCGKAFHIYRPEAKDVEGNKAWVDLNIDEEKGTLTLTIPQEFLDKAIYPLTIDPNFGYESNGGSVTYFQPSSGTPDSIDIIGSVFEGVAGTGTSISAYITIDDSVDKYKFALYKHSDSSLVTNGITDEGDGWAGTDWKTLNFTSAPTLEAIDYVICAWSDCPHYTGSYLAYDSGDTNQGHIDDNVSYGDLPDPASFAHNNNKYSIYCTYEAGGGEEIVGPFPTHFNT